MRALAIFCMPACLMLCIGLSVYRWPACCCLSGAVYLLCIRLSAFRSLSVCLSACRCQCLSACHWVSVCSSADVCLIVFLPLCMFRPADVCLPATVYLLWNCMFVCLSVCMSFCLYSCLSYYRRRRALQTNIKYSRYTYRFINWNKVHIVNAIVWVILWKRENLFKYVRPEGALKKKTRVRFMHSLNMCVWHVDLIKLYELN